ncbi:MAG TPA: TonB-dependent siderophore receptor [Xanthobacteraceae bacterium]|nr:TonB-dependent siderophore receptor [Xanthobacteraceae bacterium]
MSTKRPVEACVLHWGIAQDNRNSIRGLRAIRALPRTPISLAAGIASALLAGTAHAQQPQGSIELPTVDVDSQAGGSYQAPASTITRLPVPLRDTPQTVNVVTQQIVQEQRTLTMEDALRYIPGITFSAGEGGQQGDGPIIRGFAARGDLFRDGMRDPGWYTRDLFNADRVEVYKGPSAFAFGRGATGGAINLATKLPTGATFAETTFTGTTGPGARADLDVGGQVNPSLSARIAALYQDIDTPTRDNVWTERWGVAPSVTADIGERTRATLSYIYQGERGAPDYGLTYLPTPSYSPITGALTNPGYNGDGSPTLPLPVPRNTWYGIPTGPLKDITETMTHIVTAKVEHEFDNGVKVSNATRYIQNERFSLPTSPRSVGDANNTVFANGTGAGLVFPGYPVDQMTIGRERRERETDNTYLVNQTDLVAKFDTWGLGHTLAAGTELTHETRTQNRLDICNPVAVDCRTSVIAPDPNGSPTGGLAVPFLPIDTKASNGAVFVSDQVKLNRYLEFLTSLRYDRFSTTYSDRNTAGAANLSRDDNLFSYRFGAVFHPTEKSSLYVAYGNAYNPSAEQGTFQNPSSAALAPEQTHTIEAGAKVDVLGGRLALSGAVFRIEKTNLRINDPTNNTVSILDGIARVQGVELGAVGQITDRWSVFAGYSYLDSLITDTRDLSILGRDLPNTPPNNFTLWTTYAVTPKWTIGSGATYQSAAFGNQQNTDYVPDYWKFDAMVSYQVTEKSTLQLNVYNLTDKYYYAQYFGANVVPASGRWASLSWRIRW